MFFNLNIKNIIINYFLFEKNSYFAININILFCNLDLLMSAKLTPAQKQYLELKKKHPDAILFFRMGDFYETFYEDAKIASKILDIALTTRDRNSPNPIPMAGVPYHSADKYIQKLVQAWYKVAIAEQVGPVKPWQIVERDVVAVITPWTYLDESRLKDYNFIAAISIWTDGRPYLAFGDFSLGEYWTKDFQDLQEMQKFLSKIKPKEVILDIDMDPVVKQELSSWLNQFLQTFISVYEVPYHRQDRLKNLLWSQSLKAFWQALENDRWKVFALLAHYLSHTQKTNLKNILKIGLWSEKGKVYLDDISVKNLELFVSSYEGDEKYSLFGVINHTLTPMGSRLLKSMLLSPINDLTQLRQRLDYINRLAQLEKEKLDQLRQYLRNIGDIPRLVSTILYKKNLPSLWLRLKNYLENGLEIASNFSQFLPKFEEVKKLYQKIDQVLKPEIVSDEIDYIKDWYDSKIDELRKIAYHSDDLLLAYQAELSKFFALPVKLKYINNQGYFIEVSKKDAPVLEEKIKKVLLQKDKVDQDKFALVRRQTLKLVERYTSSYLSELENKILTAQEGLKKLEKEVLEQLKDFLQQNLKQIYDFANQIGKLDVGQNAVYLMQEKGWTLPEFWDKDLIYIIGWRHPIIEEFLPQGEEFVENDLVIWRKSEEVLKKVWRSSEEGEMKSQAIQNYITDNEWVKITEDKEILQKMGNGITGNLKLNHRQLSVGDQKIGAGNDISWVYVITGPNMGWKSTYLRQNALIVLLAHIGFVVPAKETKLWLVDGIFARVGSGDVLAKNQSTFMTEMIELSSILHNATSKSFVILDEIGRGTSTYDWMALAKAILEYIAIKIKAKTLFATHYHELTQLEWKIPGISNWSVAVYETSDQVVFLKKIVRWWASKSYGIEVARLAGLPQAIIQKAEKYLQELEAYRPSSKPKQIGLPLWVNDSKIFELEKRVQELEEENRRLKEVIEEVRRVIESGGR